MKASRSFPTRLSLKVLVTTISLFVATVIALSIITFTYSKKSSDRIAEALLEGSIKDINGMFRNVEGAALNNIWNIKEHMDEPDYMYRITWRLLENNPDIVGSTVAFIPDYFPDKGRWYAPYTYREPNTGELVSIQMGCEDYDYHHMEWYTVPMASARNSWSKPYFDDGGGDQIMSTFSIPVLNGEKKRIAVFTADISLEELSREVAAIKPYEHSYAFLVDAEGNYICHPDSDFVLKRNIVKEAQERKDKQFSQTVSKLIAGEQGYGLIKGKKGRVYLMYFGPLENGWREAIVSYYQDVFGGARKLILLFELISIACLLLLYLTNKRIIARESQPITEFTYAALNIAQGNFNASIPDVHTEDEIKRLHDSLHYLESSVNKYIKELKATTSANQRFESELGIANNIQMAMLPHIFPKRTDIDLYAALKPAKEVGGDLYDFFIRDEQLFFAVGDVSGKGVPAALFMAITRAAFRFISSMGLRVEEIVNRINNSFSEGNEQGMFVTLFVGKIDLRTLRMEYCNAGHNPIVIVSPSGAASYLKAKPNLAAGLFSDFPYQGESLQLEKGSRLLIYTDGVTEAENRAKEQYGEQRLLDFASSQPGDVPSRVFVAALAERLLGFTDGAEQNDDITMMAIKL